MADGHLADEHFTDGHLAEWTFGRQTFGRTDIWPKGHLAEHTCREASTKNFDQLEEKNLLFMKVTTY